jgi:hypothetical protein
VKEREVSPEMDGGPKPNGLVLSRVSNTRQGSIAINRNPEAGGDTSILPLVPVIVDDNKSLAASVTEPTVTSEAENVPTLLVSVASPGNVAEGSVLVKCTGSL